MPPRWAVLFATPLSSRQPSSQLPGAKPSTHRLTRLPESDLTWFADQEANIESGELSLPCYIFRFLRGPHLGLGQKFAYFGGRGVGQHLGQVGGHGTVGEGRYPGRPYLYTVVAGLG